jgi:hypothetical protein
MRGAAFVTRTQVADVLIDTSPGASLEPSRVSLDLLVRTDERGADAEPGAEREPARLRTVSTPEGARQLAPSRDGDVLFGLIYREPGKGLLYAVDPMLLLALGRHSISHYLNMTSACRVEGKERVSDHDAVRVAWLVEHVPNQPTDSGRRGTFWLVPELGYAPIRIVFERRPTPEAPWKETDRIESDDYVESDGLWVPGRVRASLYKYYDADLHHELTQECSVVFSEWKLNQQLNDDAFQLEFPDGTQVLDSVRNARYIQGQVNDREIGEAADEARELAASTTAPTPEMLAEFRRAVEANRYSRPDGHWWAWLGVALCAIVGAVLLTIALLRWARRTGGLAP